MEDVVVKQGFRFFLNPGMFFNQLQWSSRHGMIIAAFTLVALVETYFGGYDRLYEVYATMLTAQWGIGMDAALWLLTGLKVFLMISGVYLFTSFVWHVGNILGTKHSKRVLFRRLAIVFTVVLLGYTAGHLSSGNELMSWASTLLYVWGAFLGFSAIQEQFELNVVEAALVSAFALVLFSGTWKYSNHAVHEIAQTYFEESIGADFKTFKKGSISNRPY